MTPEEKAEIDRLGEECRAKGCTCLARCWEAFNGMKFWPQRAKVCTHPNSLHPTRASCNGSVQVEIESHQLTLNI